jgi:hypothetical protein
LLITSRFVGRSMSLLFSNLAFGADQRDQVVR